MRGEAFARQLKLLALMTARLAVEGLAGTMLHDGAASALEKIRVTLPKGLAERFRAWAPAADAEPPTLLACAGTGARPSR